MRKLLVGLALTATLAAGYAAGWLAREQAPVCHTVGDQEDGHWTDCDFRDGAVYIEK